MVLCADDFGMSAGVDQAIIQLAGAGRVTAVSCMAAAPCFRDHLPELLATRVELGVHLEFAGGDVGPGRLLARATLRLLDPSGVRERIERQVDAFRALAGRGPVFLDGHLHAHQFPVIRDALLEWVAAQPGPPPVLRTTNAASVCGFKARFLSALGATFRAQLTRRGLPHYADFAGAYPFADGVPYPARMRGWLRSIGDGGLIMCHPSADPAEAGVAHAAARAREFDYLRSEEFTRDCEEAAAVRVSTSALQRAPAGWP